MKKQWLSMILALCMVLCLAPTTAHAAEDETGTLRVRTEVIHGCEVHRYRHH